MKFFYSLLSLYLFSSCSHKVSVQNNLRSECQSAECQTAVSPEEVKPLAATQVKGSDELRSAIWLNAQMIFEVQYLMSRLGNCLHEHERHIKEGDFPAADTSCFEEYQGKKEQAEEARLEFEKARHEKLLMVKQSVKSQLLRCEYLPL